MASRVSFSNDVLKIEQVAITYADTAKSVRFYYNAPDILSRDVKFTGYSNLEVAAERDQRLIELDRNATFSLLAALEAGFRVDYLTRCYDRRRDDLSKHFRDQYKQMEHHVSLEQCILEGWKKHVGAAKTLISAIIGAFKYRHWLAHGQYWVPKLGQRYDFASVYQLAQEMEEVFRENSD